MKLIDSNFVPPGKRLFRRILDRLFAYETMSGRECPVYLERWTVGEAFGCGIYLHHFLGDDWAIDPHDHPRRFISIGLKGWYLEDVFRPVVDEEFGQSIPVTELESTTRYDAPWVRSFPAEHLHRVRAAECGDCWTLVIVLRKTRRWGFVKDGVWVAFKDYVFGGQSRKAC